MFHAFFICIGNGFVEDFGTVVQVLDHHWDGLLVERRHFDGWKRGR
jgi:hypothetical protein